MFRNYIIIAVRSLFKHKLYTGINIFGLAFSLALCFFVIGHISYELSFEDFQENKDRIYRVEANFSQEDHQYKTALLPYLLGKAIATEIPELETAAIFHKGSVYSVKVGEERFRVVDPHPHAMHSHGSKLFFADAEYFKVFSFPLVQGNPKTVLNEPFALVISEKAAEDYFPGENPIGKTIILNDKYECHITGILKNTPYNTQMHTDFIMSYSTLERFPETDPYGYYRSGRDLIYLMFENEIDVNATASKIESIKNNFFTAEDAAKYSMYLMPFDDLMFRGFPGAVGELNPRAEPSLIITLGLVAGFILLMAIANFINLATARSADRTKEVGVRKVFGAQRSHLMRQFLGESVLITIISSIFSLGLYEILKSIVDDFSTRPMLIDFYNSLLMIVSVMVLMVLVGIFAGLYPAVYLSRFRPITVLQSKANVKSSRSVLRKALVVFQFTIAAIFVFVSFVIYRQTSMITSTELGYDTENVLILDFDGPQAAENCQLIKNEVLGSTGILSATAASYAPGTESGMWHSFYKDEERRDDNMVSTHLIYVDYDFMNALGLELIEGRSFSEEHPEDIDKGLIINESAKKELGVDNLLGYRLYGGDSFYEVIGVVKDFHASPLNYAYRPVNILRMKPEKTTALLLKMPSDDISGTIASIGNVWDKILPGEQFEYKFLDDEISKNYDDLRGENSMFLFLCAITIGIACLGIYGLVSFTAQQRTKEIGIRKVLGADIKNIIVLLSKEFALLIAIASLIAWPVAYLMSKDFLQYFPFKVSIGFWTFLFTGSITILVAILSAGFKAYRAAQANPVETLRYE